MKLIKKFKLVSLISLAVASVSIVAGTTSVLLVKGGENQKINDVNNSDFNQNVSGNNSSIVDTNNSNSDQTIKPLIPSASNYFNAKLSSVNGPILFWNTKITSADWFGAERWSIDLLDVKDDSGVKFNINKDGHDGWKRTWLNWDLDKKNNILYILSSWGKVGGNSTVLGTPQQNVIAINVTTGKIIKVYELKNMEKDAFFAVSVLEDGNVLVYAKQGNAVTENVLINTKDKTYKIGKGNLDKISVKPSEFPSSKNYLMNLIPIGKNRNIAITYNLTGHSGTSDDNGQDQGNSQVEFILCDDNMNFIKDAQGDWKKAIKVTDAITGTKNSKIWPQRDWYKLIDNRVVTVIYDKLIIINPKNENNPELSIFTLTHDKWVESWSFDTNENLFYKNKGETEIRKVTLPKNNENPSISSYYELKNSPQEKIQKNAQSFNLYNVFGYAGQIMLINTYFDDYIKPESYPNDALSKDYGLAVAVTDNKGSAGHGDIKGLLNTEDAFQKSADFFIDQDILKNKLPSEITRNDLTFTEKGFLTNNKKTENGQLKYPPFVKTKIDDKKKELEVEVYIDQIPWFVGDNKMPDNIPPLKITKKFNSEIDINNRYWWKKAEEDYDFKNTLPSKLTEADIERINPFVVNISSQRVKVDNQNYPKLTYSIQSRDDASGKIKIKAQYDYLPLDVPVKKEKLLNIVSEKEFEIFKSSSTKSFKFIGNSEQDINKIQQLKELQEANVLPSTFQKSDKQAFLKFIDVEQTKGYPLSKMEIKVTANDANGELNIEVDPRKYDNTLSVQTKKFTGFNKNSEYSLKFENTKITFDKKYYRPSDISEEIFFDNFVTYTGFDSTDLHLELFTDDDKGVLNASLYLLTDYPVTTLKNTPFKKDNEDRWVAKHTISGFKTTDEFNKDYQLIFKNDNDSSLMKIKELTPSEIIKAFDKTPGNKNDVSLGDENYKDKHEFVKKVFVKKMGLKMPELVNSSDIIIDLFPNNSGGELTVKVVFKNVPGYNIPLTFIQIFTGFAKGNDVVTKDVLVMKNQMQLENTMKDVLKAYPSQVKKHLVDKKMDIKHFFTTEPTGDYKTAIEKNSFELIISDDDIYGELIVTIRFKREDITEQKSLLEYSQIYTNFKHY